MEWKPQPLQAGMTITVEPGIYLAGRFGVRIENTMLVVPAFVNEGNEYLRLEPLTLCPIDTNPIDFSMLTNDELQWLNEYHQLVYEQLSPLLTPEECKWLRKATVSCPSL
jgi:Xaa-Pro aminopeptidase